LLDHVGGAFATLERQHQVRPVPLQHFLVALWPGPAAELVPDGPASHRIDAARLSPHPRPIVGAIIVSGHRGSGSWRAIDTDGARGAARLGNSGRRRPAPLLSIS